jgi:hypothetical protein
LQLEAPDASLLSSPTAGFSDGRIDASKLAATLFHSGPVARNGLSLTRKGSRFHEIRSGVKGPGLLLRFLARRFLRPFGPNLSCRSRFAPVPAASSVHARYAAYGSRAWLRFPFPLPFRILRSLRIIASAEFAARRPAFRHARSPFAPRSHFYF